MGSLSAGIIGLPNAGKSTLFNALARGGAEVANFPFCTVAPNVGIVPVPDSRLDRLAQMVNPQKITPATIEVVDVAGLIKGAHKGEGLGNEFLSRIRGVDVLIEVVRCFENNISHPQGSVDPMRDVEIIKLELFLSDLKIVGKRLTRLDKLLKSGVKKNKEKIGALRKLKKMLEEGISPLKNLSPDEQDLLRGEGFLSIKPIIYVVNVGEDEIRSSSTHLRNLKKFVQEEDGEMVKICAQLEMELLELEGEDRQRFMKDMGIKERASNKLIREVFHGLELITFFTVTGGEEVRAWPVKRGTPAVEAAGRVHSDMKKGFIKAQVIPVDDFLKLRSFKKAKSEGKARLEGKDYQLRDGDVIHFSFAA